MSTVAITSTVTDGSGTPVADGTVVIARLMPGGRGFRSNGTECIGYEATTTTSGAYSLTLERNADIAVPTNTWWEIEEQVAPSAGGPSTWAINTDVAGTVYSRLVTPAADTGLEPHLTQTEADARYALIGQSGTNVTVINVRATYGTTPTQIQAAATAAYNAGGGVLWFHGGNFDWTGSAALYIDGATDVWMSPDSYFTVEGGGTAGGVKVFMAMGVNARWTGKLWRVNFREGGSLSGLGHLVSFFDCEDFVVEGCNVYSTTSGSFSDGNIFKGTNNSGWKTITGSVRRRGKVLYNTINVNQTGAGSEGISFAGVDSSNRAEDIEIIGNKVLGVGDDVIALHSSTRCKIIGNTVAGVDGRIFYSDSTDLEIIGNSCEHTDATGGDAFIEGTWESAQSAIYQAPTDVVIANNKMLIKDGQTNISKGIWLLGCQQHHVIGNRLRNRNSSGSTVSGLYTQGKTHDSTLRKTGFISVDGNHFYGARIRIAPSTERDFWTMVGPNYIYGKNLLDDLIDFSSCGDVLGDAVVASGGSAPLTSISTTTAGSIYNVSGYAVINPVLLGIWHLKDIPANTTTALTLQNTDLTTVTTQRPFAICTVRSRFGAAPDHTATFNVKAAGSTWISPTHTNAAGAETANYGTSGARYSRLTLPAATAMSIDIVTVAGWATTQDCEVELWGIPCP